MENVLFDVPSMYADHHVIAVRQALLAVPGVEDVWASSAWQQVQVTYNPAAISPGDLGRVLEQAGYSVSNGHVPPAPAPGPHAKDPAWDALGVRVTHTQQADLAMSGEFRRY